MFDAIVLTGGASRRLDGVDKATLVVGGRMLVARVVDAVADAHRIVVVGPRIDEPSLAHALWCREEPPGGGPVAAIAAALRHLAADRVVVLAVDLPFIAAAIPPLLAALDNADAATLVDADGRANYVAAAWRTDAVRSAVDAVPDVVGASLRSLYATVHVASIVDAGWGQDCDTPEQLAAAQARADAEGNLP